MQYFVKAYPYARWIILIAAMIMFALLMAHDVGAASGVGVGTRSGGSW